MVSGAGAMASTINESSIPGGDFPNNGPGYLLPIGTNVVTGQVHVEAGDTADFFEFQGLTPNSLLQVTAITDFPYDGLFVAAYTSNGTYLQGESLEGGTAILKGPVPANGDLVIEVAPFTGVGGAPCENCYGSYQVSLASVPEPSALAGTGLAIGAGVLAWRRRRRTEK